MNEKTKQAMLIGILILFMLGGIVWAVWQYSLCYPEVSRNVWYCIGHAVR